MATAMSRTMPALMVNRSSRVIPGCQKVGLHQRQSHVASCRAEQRVCQGCCSAQAHVCWDGSSPLCRITPSRLGGVRTFLGMPAGMTTMSAPVRASLRPSSSRVYPVTTEGVSTCEMSAATPLTTGTMSYRARVRIAGDCLSRSAKGCPIPGERERVSRYDTVRTTSSADESDLESHFDVGREKGRTDFAAHSPP